ncbi:DUF3426 domain-containing protein [Wenzhouxiangella marina]|uniref:Uncharacterized protein n=1 Tax=Wenzhouxiangella marina TaxID=1579979 RepID=A0A0K0XSF3_9GAMM|nr:DUF3426 domain-containing protein [Wenzhouxiangella marina]AKS40552.1 hypothetical protein WM2015_163 [Wenzhouxiangella marina]MBB6088320.1 putative Zn finger-like uncharacterized protein [Wenzhouxiangella marina]
MFTRCPGCQSVYALDAQRLAEAAGMVRCGHCGKTFNSLSSLFNEHPRADDSPLTGAGMPPMLDYRAIVQPELPGVSLFEEETVEQEPGPTLNLPETAAGPRPASPAWAVASLALGLALILQLALQWRAPDSALAGLFGREAGPVTPAEVGQAIQIISRDMHRHPTLDDAVIVSATLRNTSDERLDWPVLEVRLYDPSQQILGVRRLMPADYLQNAANVDIGMPTELLVPVILEFVVGTTLPSGFDFRFY